jgi:hypothetical protein
MSPTFVLVVFLNLATGLPQGQMTGLAANKPDCYKLASEAIAKHWEQAPEDRTGTKPVIYCLDLPSSRASTDL